MLCWTVCITLLEVSFRLRRILPAPPFSELNRPVVPCVAGSLDIAVCMGAGLGGGIVGGGVGRGGGVGVVFDDCGGIGRGGGDGLGVTSICGGSLRSKLFDSAIAAKRSSNCAVVSLCIGEVCRHPFTRS